MGELASDSFLLDPYNYCKFEINGIAYFIMDPSYRCVKRTDSGEERPIPEEGCDVRWGLCSDDLPKNVVIEPISCE